MWFFGSRKKELRFVTSAKQGWESPTGFDDEGLSWNFETLAYDKNDISYAEYDGYIETGETADGISFSQPATLCNKIKFLPNTEVMRITIEVYYSGAWHVIYNAIPVTSYIWIEKVIPDGWQLVSGIRWTFYNPHVEVQWPLINEMYFWNRRE